VRHGSRDGRGREGGRRDGVVAALGGERGRRRAVRRQGVNQAAGCAPARADRPATGTALRRLAGQKKTACADRPVKKKTACAVWFVPWGKVFRGVLAFLGGPGGTALGEGLGAGFPPDARRDTLEKRYTPGTMGRLLEISRHGGTFACERLLTGNILGESGKSNAHVGGGLKNGRGNPDLAGQGSVCYRLRPLSAVCCLPSADAPGQGISPQGNTLSGGEISGGLAPRRRPEGPGARIFFEHCRGSAARDAIPGFTSCPE